MHNLYTLLFLPVCGFSAALPNRVVSDSFQSNPAAVLAPEGFNHKRAIAASSDPYAIAYPSDDAIATSDEDKRAVAVVSDAVAPRSFNMNEKEPSPDKRAIAVSSDAIAHGEAIAPHASDLDEKRESAPEH